jgi:hypothetical protein
MRVMEESGDGQWIASPRAGASMTADSSHSAAVIEFALVQLGHVDVEPAVLASSGVDLAEVLSAYPLIHSGLDDQPRLQCRSFAARTRSTATGGRC